MTINNNSKNSLSITNEDKKPTGSDITWDEATFTWNEAEGTWDSPGISVSKESKNNITITNENKN